MSEYKHLYSTTLWQGLRKQILLRDNFTCAHCGTLCLTGRPRHPRNAVVDHITPHRGNMALFVDPDNLQTLHKACHDRWKQGLEKSNRMQREDGWNPS